MSYVLLLAIAICVLAILNQILIPMPLDVIIIGMCKASGNIPLIIGFTVIGLTIGAILDYLAGRYSLKFIKHHKRKLNHRNFKKAQKFYNKYGVVTNALTFIPFIGKYFPLVAGVMDTSFSTFFLIYVTGRVVYYSIIGAGIYYI